MRDHLSAMQCEDTVLVLADLFKVLGSSTRVQILCILSRGETSVRELAERTALSESTISHQLQLLKAAKLVRMRRCGKNVLYDIADGSVYAVLTHGVHCVNARNLRKLSG